MKLMYLFKPDTQWVHRVVKCHIVSQSLGLGGVGGHRDQIKSVREHR